jgi:hypothetical protein
MPAVQVIDTVLSRAPAYGLTKRVSQNLCLRTSKVRNMKLTLIIFCAVLAISRFSIESEAIITLVLVLVPIILGILALRVALRRREQTGIGSRGAIVILGLTALLARIGLYVGQALMLLASIMPVRSSIPPKKAA